MPRADAIFLHGTSSSGKTTLAKAFQRAMPEPTLYVSNDNFIFMAADHVLKDEKLFPKVLFPLLSAFHKSLPIVAACGFPMVIDHVIENDEWMDEVAGALKGHRIYFVKVSCPLEELERREQARGDRRIGQARWQLGRVHGFCGYDVEVDTHCSTVDQNVQQLVDLIYSGAEPTALAEYRTKRLG
jgi:chloramphenicol 3-O phosphotransferase